MKNYNFVRKHGAVVIIITAPSFDEALYALENIFDGDNENDYYLASEVDGHEELPHGNEHWNDEKAKRPTPEDCMHITQELKAQLDEVSKNRYFTPDENTKKV
jgi:hypothetical protein